MTEMTKTLTFAGVAGGLLAAATAATWIPDRGGAGAAFAQFKQGTPFFPEFKDPTAATTLEVVEYDEATASQRPFKVELKNGKWTIPSHYDYPADGKDRLSKTASGVIDLKKDTIRSVTPEDHEALGVIDPIDAKATALKGRGKRVTLRDKDGKVLADFIIGKPVKERAGQRYVRVPDQKATYGVKVDVDLSTKFADWIETNLLKLDSLRLRSVHLDSTKVDPERGVLIPGEKVALTRKDSSAPWTIDGLPPEKEVNTTTMSDLTSALGDVKIVGIRPKPEGLSRDLKVTDSDKISTGRQGAMSLASRGFYLTKQGDVYSNQGEAKLATDEGLVYTLRFGEASFATGEALSAGSAEESAEAEAKKGEADDQDKDKDKGTGSRYLMVSVGFDPELIKKPDSLERGAAETDEELPADVFARTEEEKKAEKAKADREKADYETRLADGKKKAEELADRFAGWYYLTPDSAFKKLMPERSTLTRAKGEKPATPPGGDAPNPFGGGLPGGSGLSLPAGHP